MGLLLSFFNCCLPFRAAVAECSVGSPTDNAFFEGGRAGPPGVGGAAALAADFKIWCWAGRFYMGVTIACHALLEWSEVFKLYLFRCNIQPEQIESRCFDGSGGGSGGEADFQDMTFLHDEDVVDHSLREGLEDLFLDILFRILKDGIVDSSEDES